MALDFHYKSLVFVLMTAARARLGAGCLCVLRSGVEVVV